MKTEITVVIVDDEPLAREYLRSLLAQEDDVKIVAECRNGKQAVSVIRELHPDLVFLDIQMPGMNGFGVIEAVGVDAMPAVIFVTAFDQFAVKAFETHALDYLLKPFDQERFTKALTRARRLLSKQSHTQDLQALIAEMSSNVTTVDSKKVQGGEWLSRIPIKTVERSYLLRTEDIDWVEAADYCVLIHSRGQSHILRETMKWIEQHLDPKRFCRIHRGSIVNLDRIKELRPGIQADWLIIMADGKQLEMSRRRRKHLESVLGRKF